MLFALVMCFFLIIALIGVPILWSLVATTLLYIVVSPNAYYLTSIFLTFIDGIEPFHLLAIPLFIIAGELMSHGGISRRMIALAAQALGFLPGGLGVVTVSSSMLFAGVSGSAVADSAAVGSVMIPGMVKRGYTKEFSAALVAVAGTIGNIIPPSIPMIIFAFIGNVSVKNLFLAGFIPGLLFGLALIGWSMYVGWSRGYDRGGGGFSAAALAKSFVECLPALGMPVIVLGGIFSGIFTATEASAVAVLYAFILGLFIYRELQWRAIPGIFIRSLIMSATVLLIIGATSALAWIVTFEAVPMQLVEYIRSLSLGKEGFLLLVNVVLLALGIFLEPVPALILTAPLLIPMASALGIDLVHLGIIMVCNISIGLFTPPVGGTLFVAAKIANAKMGGITIELIPQFILCVGVLLIVTYCPGFVMLPVFWFQ